MITAKKPVRIQLQGVARRGPGQKWICRQCLREFKLPKIPATCETLYSLCMTCFALECIPEDERWWQEND